MDRSPIIHCGTCLNRVLTLIKRIVKDATKATQIEDEGIRPLKGGNAKIDFTRTRLTITPVNPRNVLSSSRLRRHVLSMIGLWAAMTAGCGNVSSNWDMTWWKQERRLVQPTPRDESAEAASSSSAANPDSTGGGAAGGATSETRPAASTSARPEGPTPIRVFQYLYLVAEGSEISESARREARVMLRNVDPRSCGTLLEMLYVPMGKSGSRRETYLMFEQPDEFERAMSFALLLDVPSPDESTPDAWQTGVACLLALVEAGPAPDKSLVERCEKKLAEIVDADTGGPMKQWAAAIFAGRVAADYRYEYGAARDFYARAARFAEAGSIEALTAEWWTADSYSRQAATRSANEAYEDILDGYTHLYPKSQIIQRSSAALRKNRKK